MKKTSAKAFLLTVCAAVLLNGCNLFNYEDQNHKVALSTPRAAEYTKRNVIRGSIERAYSGVAAVQSFSGQRYSFTYGGSYVSAINVRLGDTVKAGDALVTLDTSALKKDLARAEDNMNYLKTLYDETVTASGENSASASSAYLNYRDAERVYEGLKDLMENSVLRSEVDGCVRYINTKYTASASDDPNRTVVPGETMVVVDPEDKESSFAVFRIKYGEESYSMGIGTEVSLKKTNSKDAETFTGKIVGSSNLSYENSEIQADIYYYVSLENAPDDISVGNNLSVNYIEESAENCILIPSECLYEFESREFVYILDSQGFKRECYVETGIKSDTFVQILSGLEEGDVIIQN